MTTAPNVLFTGLSLLWLSCAAIDASGSPRSTALIIGNGDYSSGALKNAARDASAIEVKLRELGVVTTLILNADRRALEQGIQKYKDTVIPNGVSLLYYAGHGMQI